MRLWSIHPKYLDSQGLVALWREGLLAQKVLLGKTKGYRHHPQLERFRKRRAPIAAIGFYLSQIVNEAERRNYRFDRSKIIKPRRTAQIPVTRGQLKYEAEHLLKKLKQRDPALFIKWSKARTFSANPIFRVVAGEVEDWERILS